MAAPCALLVIHETESLHAADPALTRYYQLVEDLQRHYGQQLNVGAILDASFERTPWKVSRSESIVLEKSARDMAQLHLANLRTWRSNEYALQTFNQAELRALEHSLERIASGQAKAGTVQNIARQIVAHRV